MQDVTVIDDIVYVVDNESFDVEGFPLVLQYTLEEWEILNNSEK